MISRIAIPVALFAGFASVANAQSVVVPASAGGIEGGHYNGKPFGQDTDWRTQHILAGASICKVQSFITHISFRPDNELRWSGAAAAQTIPNVVVKLSHTTTTPEVMGKTFATNITGTETIVYSGPVTLPAFMPNGDGTPANWDIVLKLNTAYPYVRAQGDLLIDITATDVAPTSINYSIDNHYHGGAAAQFGTTGPIAGGYGAALDALGQGSIGKFSSMCPGGSLDVDFSTTGSGFWGPYLPNGTTGAVLFGLARRANPFDLGLIGMTGNSLYIDFITGDIPVTLNQGMRGGPRSLTTLPIPNIPVMAGSSIYMQGVLMHAPSNVIGLVTTNAVQAKLAASSVNIPGQAPMETKNVVGNASGDVDGYMSTSTAAVIKLDGFFN